MSFKQISRQACLVYRAVRNAAKINNTQWITVREIVAYIDANPRTVRGILKQLVEADVLISRSTFAGYHYTLVPNPKGEAKDIAERILSAEKTLRITEEAA